MALVTCVDCGKQHSDQAVACPNCARPRGAQQARTTAPHATVKTIPCGKCGKQITEYPCVFCAARGPRPASASSKPNGCIMAAGVGVLALGLFALVTTVFDPLRGTAEGSRRTEQVRAAREEAEDVSLAAVVDSSESVLTIRNDNMFQWHDCRVSVNETGLLGGNGYETSLKTVEVKKVVTIPLQSLTKDDGTIFQPIITRVANIAILCKDGGGKQRAWTGQR